MTRSGLPVGGTTTPLSETALAWTASEPASWQAGGERRLAVPSLLDLRRPPSPVQTAPRRKERTRTTTPPGNGHPWETWCGNLGVP